MPRTLLALPFLFALNAAVTSAAEPRPRVEFTRLIAHWDAYGDREKYLSFVADAEPEIAQVGFYGAHFYSLAHTKDGAGYPAHFPVVGLNECGDWFEQLNRDVHARRAKVVGHFNVKFVIGDPDGKDGPRGFFKFYRDLWDEKELGARPAADPLDLLEKNADGTPRTNNNYSVGGMREYWGCLNNPHWQTVLKAWAKRGIERGVDGYIANYFYRHDCHCEHCVREFKTYLRERFDDRQLAEQFEIPDLKNHRFREIVAWHDPKESTALRREMLRFSQLANKRAFDEVLVKYARSLKPDLIVAQWNHLGDFQQISGDERCLLPGDVWGRDEDYTWYSTGGAANFTDLDAGIFGDATLQARYIRGAFDDKPFTLGKYEATRIRTAIAELAANGGAPMGFYTRFTDPAAREVIVRYYQFLKQHDHFYRGNRPHGEALLVFPRSQVHAGNLAPLERFKQQGKQLLDEHVLFDVLPDDQVTEETARRYLLVIDPALEKGAELPKSISRFDAPPAVRVSLSRSNEGKKCHLHLVNYNRAEPSVKRSPGSGIADERPVAAAPVRCSLRCPEPCDSLAAVFYSPDHDPIELKTTIADGRAEFTVPTFDVYAVVELTPAKK